MDQGKKTMRHFYCRDVLWDTFEQMANDFDCSIDYLINEAMRYYARSKNYQASTVAPGSSVTHPPEGLATRPPPLEAARTMQPGARRIAPPPPPGPGSEVATASPARRAPSAPPPSVPGPSARRTAQPIS